MKPYILCVLLFICPALLLNCRTPGPTIETKTPKEEEIIQKKLQSELDEYLSERVFDTVNISKPFIPQSSADCKYILYLNEEEGITKRLKYRMRIPSLFYQDGIVENIETSFVKFDLINYQFIDTFGVVTVQPDYMEIYFRAPFNDQDTITSGLYSLRQNDYFNVLSSSYFYYSIFSDDSIYERLIGCRIFQMSALYVKFLVNADMIDMDIWLTFSEMNKNIYFYLRHCPIRKLDFEFRNNGWFTGGGDTDWEYYIDQIK